MKRLFRNSFLLLFCQLGGMLIPLIELPIFTRHLTPALYGEVIYILSASLIASTLIEFGFTFSASREIAKNKNTQMIGTICSDVFAAKIIISIITVSFLCCFLLLSPHISIPISGLIYASLITLAMGFSPIWYFLGTEKLLIPALFDIFIRILGLITLIIFLPIFPTPNTALIIIAITSIVNTTVPSIIMLLQIEIRPLSWERALTNIQSGFHIFAFKSISTMQQTIASLLLGFFGNSQLVGIFTPAEKLNKAIIGLLTPIINVFFPFFIKNTSSSDKTFFIFFTISLVAVLCVIAAILGLLAPFIIDIIFGESYTSSIRILQFLVLLLPLKGLNLIISFLWFIPLGKEKLVNKISLFSLSLLIPLAIFAIPIYGIIGFSIGLIIIEIFTSILFLSLLIKTWNKL